MATALQHLLLLCCLALLHGALAHSSHHHSRDKLIRKYISERNSTAGANGSLAHAENVVLQFQAAMAKANAVILGNPQPNVHELLDSTSLPETRAKAAPLAYRDLFSQNGTLTRRFSNDSFAHGPYTVPTEVVEAARILAEANPPPSTDYDLLLTSVRSQMRPQGADTNIMAQRFRRPSGLYEFVPPETFTITYQNGTSESMFDKRSEVSYWQESMIHRGTAPYAPDGYRVWRDVKDYGAKGDGVTDDTAAINRAISDGGRCGANCPATTKLPATVYFPAGTYLVSSPIYHLYNTEFIGNPLQLPVILAAHSFSGLSVITSDVYTARSSQWYLNTPNFLRNIRNFIIDLRAVPQSAEVCGIHWQAGQGSSLDNIVFIMTSVQDTPDTTQKGLYVENGSGGFFGDLTFVGGRIGASFGNQQFTTANLLFSGCATGLQVHLDLGWSLQDLTFRDCTRGVVVVNSADGVGSLVLTDIYMENVPVGIDMALPPSGSTALYIQNGGFQNVNTVVHDTSTDLAVYPGTSGAKVDIVSWGVGSVTDETGETGYINGAPIPSPNYPDSLVVSSDMLPRPRLFHRRRPSYATLGNSQLFDVKEWGAKGDGKTDDTAVLNRILDVAANLSAIVYIPHGIYIISDTLRVPVGSRIIGQAWPQIMAVGSAFEGMAKPKATVQVGQPGSVGVVEIQSVLFTVGGGVAGAVLVEWNIHESSQGSAGLWDSHFRVGGAVGSHLQVDDCGTSVANSNCIAASLLMRITPKASAYLQNVWMWVADHDVDAQDQDPILVYAARGLLVESQGPTWLWGTSVSHAVLYQYQFARANNTVVAPAQAEAPFFQPIPPAPFPFTRTDLAFRNDPAFEDCSSSSCGMAWAVRVVDSSNTFVLSTAMSTWFSSYNGECTKEGRNTCQLDSFHIEQSFNTWVYNLVVTGVEHIITPLNGAPISAAGVVGDEALSRRQIPSRSSLLGFFEGTNQMMGFRVVTGYELYELEDLAATEFPSLCKTALTATILCEDETREWIVPRYHGSLENTTVQEAVCDPGCGESLADWVHGVNTHCAGHGWISGEPLTLLAQLDDTTDEFCTDIMANFTGSDSLDEMPTIELCSDCFLGRLQMMQESPFSIFSVFPWYQSALEMAIDKCSLSGVDTSPQPPLVPPLEHPTICASGVSIVVTAGTSCDDLALLYGVSSASIFQAGAPLLTNCTSLPAMTICKPLTCDTYQLDPEDDCWEASANAEVEDISLYNPWINPECDNLHVVNVTLGTVLCASPPGGLYVPGTATNTSTFPWSGQVSYGTSVVAPPTGVTVAPSSSLLCSKWHIATAEDTCATITGMGGIPLVLFASLNPSVNLDDSCVSSLVAGYAYCVQPVLAESMAFPYEATLLGCYVNADPDKHVLDAWFSSSENMTVESCGQSCLPVGSSLFGLTDSDTCLCGSQLLLDSYEIDMSNCDSVCVGNSSETCGGDNGATSIYSTFPDVTLSYQTLDVGCFPDTALAGGQTHVLTTTNSRAACAAICLPEYPWFGVSKGTDCRCATGLHYVEPINQLTNCMTNCSGDPFEFCGGPSAVQVLVARPSLNDTSTPVSSSSSSSIMSSSATSSSSTTIATSTTTTTTATPTPSATCNGGTGTGGYTGLCDYSCQRGFCPSPCTCTSTGTPVSGPPVIPGERGYAHLDVNEDFGPLCDFTCSRGYCPGGVCVDTPYSVIQEPGTVCVQGTGTGNYEGLCNFCCRYAYCPPGPCTCTLYGVAIPELPVLNTPGIPAPGMDESYTGLCSYACNHDYCPPEACVYP